MSVAHDQQYVTYETHSFIQLHADLIGERNNVIIPKRYLELVEWDYVAAVVLRDIVAFTAWSIQHKDRDGWFYRNENTWLTESGLSLKQVNRSITKLNAIAEGELIQKRVTKVRLDDGTITNETATHYRLDGAIFAAVWGRSGNRPNGSSGNLPNGSSGNRPNGSSLTYTQEGKSNVGKDNDFDPNGSSAPTADAGAAQASFLPDERHGGDEPAAGDHRDGAQSSGEQPAAKERKPNPVWDIVAAYCEAAGIERVANKGKATGNAKRLHEAGWTPDDVREAMTWLQGETWHNGAIDLGTVLAMADQFQTWRASQSKPKRSSPTQPNMDYLV